MRIRRLDLTRYGHFTDFNFKLPVTEPDFHIVIGPNEAGKSTALSAIEDLLFGIPHNSTRNFLHDYNSMRIGALLESGGETLDLQRRKGNRDTLLDKNGTPLPTGDAALAGLLAGADKAFFTRMFCLDHERLKTGGQEILQAQDDVGQMLFSAGAGIVGLRDRRKAIDEEADALWANRRAAHRKYYQADDRLKAAEASLRERTVTAAKWQELKTALEDANAVYGSVEAEIETKSAELRKLNRVRRVFRDVRKRSQLADEIAALGDVLLLPEDAVSALDEAIREDNAAATRIETLTEEIETLQKERSELSYDEAFLIRADDIDRLHERRIQIRVGRTDLPKRRTELTIAEAQLARLAAELEWETGDSSNTMRRIPTRPKLTSARTLLNRHGELNSAVETAKAAVAEAEDKASDLARQWDSNPRYGWLNEPQIRARGPSNAQARPKPAIILSRMDWHSATDRAVMRSVPGNECGPGPLLGLVSIMPSEKPRPVSPDSETLHIEIARLRSLEVGELRARWHTTFQRRAPPHLPRHLLFRILAYRLQADQFADLDTGTLQAINLVDDYDVDLSRLNVSQQTLQSRSIGRTAGESAIVVSIVDQGPGRMRLASNVGF
jgi:hypothetical protein